MRVFLWSKISFPYPPLDVVVWKRWSCMQVSATFVWILNAFRFNNCQYIQSFSSVQNFTLRDFQSSSSNRTPVRWLQILTLNRFNYAPSRVQDSLSLRDCLTFTNQHFPEASPVFELGLEYVTLAACRLLSEVVELKKRPTQKPARPSLETGSERQTQVLPNFLVGCQIFAHFLGLLPELVEGGRDCWVVI